MSNEALRVRCIALMKNEAQRHLLDFPPLQELCGQVPLTAALHFFKF
jgi:hypothetical protein